MDDFPADPMSIEITLEHIRYWWQVDDDRPPETWRMSADIRPPNPCEPHLRHVARLSMAVVDLDRGGYLFDSMTSGEWALEYIAETVVGPDGALHPELDAMVSPGPPRMLIMRQIDVAAPWRGRGIGAALISAAVSAFAPTARIAVCRVSAGDFRSESPDRMSAELIAVRWGALLEKVGFRLWRGVHVVDVRDEVLDEVRWALVERWDRDSKHRRGW